jgi:SPP1 gp7 family putative phage head morphogenesis protein
MDINELANQFRLALLAKEERASARMVIAYGRVALRLERDGQRILERIERQQAAGDVIGPAVLFQDQRIRDLKLQVSQQIDRWADTATAGTADLQRYAAERVPEDTRRLVVAAAGRAPREALDLLHTTWTDLPVGAIEALVGRTSAGGPLNRLFDQIAPAMAEGVEHTLLNAVAQGLHPTVAARELRNVFGVGMNRALLITRTETIKAYREGTRQTYVQNRDVVDGWIWHSALQQNTCAACWAMHGTFHTNDETLDGHPRCRCAMIPRTKGWEELGFIIPTDTRPVIRTGTAIFAEQPPHVQEKVLGKKAFAQYRDGNLALVDLLARNENAQWGTMRYTRSLKAVEAGTGGEWVGAAALR